MNFQKTPFGLPPTVKDSDSVASVLRKSYGLQKKLRVSNACGFINVILERCFRSIGIEAELVYGTLDLSELKLPHVWLRIHGHVIDNTYCEDIPAEVFASMKENAKYLDGVLEDGMYMGDHVTENLGIEDHNMKTFKWILENPDKALVLMKNKTQLQQYYDGMATFVKFAHGATLPEVVQKGCWRCNSETEKLKICGKCKAAKYCEKKCQQEDWKAVHKLICLAPNSF